MKSVLLVVLLGACVWGAHCAITLTANTQFSKLSTQYKTVFDIDLRAQPSSEVWYMYLDLSEAAAPAASLYLRYPTYGSAQVSLRPETQWSMLGGQNYTATVLTTSNYEISVGQPPNYAAFIAVPTSLFFALFVVNCLCAQYKIPKAQSSTQRVVLRSWRSFCVFVTLLMVSAGFIGLAAGLELAVFWTIAAVFFVLAFLQLGFSMLDVNTSTLQVRRVKYYMLALPLRRATYRFDDIENFCLMPLRGMGGALVYYIAIIRSSTGGTTRLTPNAKLGNQKQLVGKLNDMIRAATPHISRPPPLDAAASVANLNIAVDIDEPEVTPEVAQEELRLAAEIEALQAQHTRSSSGNDGSGPDPAGAGSGAGSGIAGAATMQPYKLHDDQPPPTGESPNDRLL